MGLRKYRSGYMLGIVLLLTSCSPSLYDIAVDIRQPAVTPINDIENKSIAIYIAAEELDSVNSKDSLLWMNFASGLASGFEEHLELSEGAVYIYTHYPDSDQIYTMDYIQSLSRQADSDLVIVVDSLVVSDFALMENLATGASHSLQYMHAQFRNKISVYDGITAEKVTSISQKDTVYWQILANSKQDIDIRSSGVSAAVGGVSSKIGEHIVSLFVPYWVTEHRYLFVYGTSSWRVAFNHAVAFNWDRAIDIWSTELNHKNRYRAACAAVNIAVGCEMTGRPEFALEWLETAEKMCGPGRLSLDSYKLRLRQEIEKGKK